jgi:hypothetical protein
VALDLVLENLHTAWGDEVSAKKYTLVGMASAINAFQGHVAVDGLKACGHERRIII